MSPVSIHVKTAAEKYRALTRRSSIQMGIGSLVGIVLEIAAFNSCVSKIEEGWAKGEKGDRRFEKGVRSSLTGRRFQIKTTTRHERKREIFHELCNGVAIPCFFFKEQFFFFFLNSLTSRERKLK